MAVITFGRKRGAQEKDAIVKKLEWRLKDGETISFLKIKQRKDFFV
jgi:hypothetical protein